MTDTHQNLPDWVTIESENPNTYPAPFKRIEALIPNCNFPDGCFHVFCERVSITELRACLSRKKYPLLSALAWRYVV